MLFNVAALFAMVDILWTSVCQCPPLGPGGHSDEDKRPIGVPKQTIHCALLRRLHLLLRRLLLHRHFPPPVVIALM